VYVHPRDGGADKISICVMQTWKRCGLRAYRLAETVFTRAKTKRGLMKSGVNSVDGGKLKGWSA
jgi:hypothetical protein